MVLLSEKDNSFYWSIEDMANLSGFFINIKDNSAKKMSFISFVC